MRKRIQLVRRKATLRDPSRTPSLKGTWAADIKIFTSLSTQKHLYSRSNGIPHSGTLRLIILKVLVKLNDLYQHFAE